MFGLSWITILGGGAVGALLSGLVTYGIMDHKVDSAVIERDNALTLRDQALRESGRFEQANLSNIVTLESIRGSLAQIKGIIDGATTLATAAVDAQGGRMAEIRRELDSARARLAETSRSDPDCDALRVVTICAAYESAWRDVTRESINARR